MPSPKKNAAFPVRRSEANPDEPIIALGYIRCSTEEQADSGLGLEAQRRRITAYCVAKGYRLLDTFEDAGHSARSMDRPYYKAMRERMVTERAAGKPIGVIVCAKMDRLSRVTRDFLNAVDEIEREGTSIAFVDMSFDTTTAQGRMFLTILAAMAQWEREINGERTSAAMHVLKDRNKRYTRCPSWGFRALQAGGLMVVPSELEIIELIFRLRFIDHYSPFAIGENLRLRGFTGFYCKDGQAIERRMNPLYLTVMPAEIRNAAAQAGLDPKPLPVGSLLTYDPNAILACSKPNEEPTLAGPMPPRVRLAS